MTFYKVSFSCRWSFCGFFVQENWVEGKKIALFRLWFLLLAATRNYKEGFFFLWHHRRSNSSCKSSQETFLAGFFFFLSHLVCACMCVRFTPCSSDQPERRLFFPLHFQVQTWFRKQSGRNIGLIQSNHVAQWVWVCDGPCLFFFFFWLCYLYLCLCTTPVVHLESQILASAIR